MMRIQATSKLIISTNSLIRLPVELCEAPSSGIYLKFSDSENREYLTQKYALTRYIEKPNEFLQSLDSEGLLFRSDTPEAIDHFIPQILHPVENGLQQDDQNLPEIGDSEKEEENKPIINQYLSEY
ncbi:MAG: hypothetical protein ACXAB2_16050 [Candidatus Hodarchaeales archaeon]|jgi:hypothetical protein